MVDPLQQRFRQFTEKSRRHVVTGLAVQHAALREQQIQPPPCSGQRDIHQPPLFLHALRPAILPLVAYASQFMTLTPGMIISTGTPAGVAMGMKPEPIYLKAGDRLELSVTGLGTQRSRVVNSPWGG